MSSNISTLYKSLRNWDSEADLAALSQLAQEYAAIPNNIYGKSTARLKGALGDFIKIERELFALKLKLKLAIEHGCEEADYYLYSFDGFLDCAIREGEDAGWSNPSGFFVPLKRLHAQIRTYSTSVAVVSCETVILLSYLGNPASQAIAELAEWIIPSDSIAQLHLDSLYLLSTAEHPLPPIVTSSHNLYQRPQTELRVIDYLITQIRDKQFEIDPINALADHFILNKLRNCFGLDERDDTNSINWTSWEQVPYTTLMMILIMQSESGILATDMLIEAVASEGCFETDPFAPFYAPIASALSDLTGLDVTEDDAKFLVTLILETFFEAVFPYAEIVLFIRALSQGDYVGAILEVLPMDTFLNWLWRRFGKAAAETAVITMMGKLPKLADVIRRTWRAIVGQSSDEVVEEGIEEGIEETTEEVIEETTEVFVQNAGEITVTIGGRQLTFQRTSWGGEYDELLSKVPERFRSNEIIAMAAPSQKLADEIGVGVVWIDKGHPGGGLTHIMQREHIAQLSNKFEIPNNEQDALNFIMETVNTQTPVEVTSRLDNNGRLGYTAFYEIQLDDGTLAILQVAIGSNGFIVTASPSKLPK